MLANQSWWGTTPFTFLKGLEKETCLIPAVMDQEPEFAPSYNLVTENLVLTQYTLHLGFHRYCSRRTRRGQEWQSHWRESLFPPGSRGWEGAEGLPPWALLAVATGGSTALQSRPPCKEVGGLQLIQSDRKRGGVASLGRFAFFLLDPSLPSGFSLCWCGLYRLHDQLIKINQSLHRLQVAWREAQQSSSPTADSLREQFERLMTIYLSTKTAMTEPQMLQNCLNLQVSMSVLLVQLSAGNRGTEFADLTFPLPEVKESALAYVPGD